MTDDICTHGDLLDACIDCTVAPPAPQAQQPAAGEFVFYASFEGDCSGPCTMRIEKGRELDSFAVLLWLARMQAGEPNLNLDDVVQQIAAMTDGTYRHRSCVDRWTDGGA